MTTAMMELKMKVLPAATWALLLAMILIQCVLIAGHWPIGLEQKPKKYSL